MADELQTGDQPLIRIRLPGHMNRQKGSQRRSNLYTRLRRPSLATSEFMPMTCLNASPVRDQRSDRSVHIPDHGQSPWQAPGVQKAPPIEERKQSGSTYGRPGQRRAAAGVRPGGARPCQVYRLAWSCLVSRIGRTRLLCSEVSVVGDSKLRIRAAIRGFRLLCVQSP